MTSMERIPRYRKVSETLRQEIASGALAVGSKLSTEDELCQRFGVSRHTVRTALRELRDQHFIRSQQGAGSTVLQQNVAPLYTSTVSSVEELVQYVTEARYEVAKSGIVVADHDLAQRLGAPVGQRWLRVEGIRTRVTEKTPVCWTEVFVHGDYAGIGLLIGRTAGTIFSGIEEMYSVTIEEVRQTLRVIAMPDEISDQLTCEPGGMAVEIRRSYYLAKGSLVEVAFNMHPASHFQYELTLRKRS